MTLAKSARSDKQNLDWVRPPTHLRPPNIDSKQGSTLNSFRSPK